jgi:hypothetical protein
VRSAAGNNVWPRSPVPLPCRDAADTLPRPAAYRDALGAELTDREQRFVLPREQHVADLTLHERIRRAAGAAVEHRNAGVQFRHERLRLRLGRRHALARRRVVKGRPVAAELAMQDRAPGRQVIPPGAPGSLRIGRDDLHARLEQIGPIADLLRISLPHQKDDRRGVRRAVVGEAGLPVRAEPLALTLYGVDVVRQRKRNDVRCETVDHGPRLGAGARVRLLDREALTSALFPVRCERFIEIAVELARRVVAHVEQRQAIARAVAAVAARSEQRGAGKEHCYPDHAAIPSLSRAGR